MSGNVKFYYPGKEITVEEKTEELLRPKRVCMMNHLTRSTPLNYLFERDGGIYIGPSDGYFYEDGKYSHHPGRYADEDSKWFYRDCLVDVVPSALGAKMLDSFCKVKYEEFIRSKLWDEIPELYGKIIGCWCVCSCRCQVSVLRRLVRERIKHDFADVDETKYQELKLKYALSKEEMKILEDEVRWETQYSDSKKSKLEYYLACLA